MRRAFIVVAACAIFVAAPKAQQATGELAIAPGVVDVRGMLKEDGTLDRLKARARGIDPDQVRLPRKIKDVPPDFREAIQTGVNGTVVIDCIIDTEGEPQNCRIVSGPLPLRDLALKAVVSWRWEPLRIADTPRKAAVQSRVSFAIREPFPE
jgi:TonB family protein